MPSRSYLIRQAIYNNTHPEDEHKLKLKPETEVASSETAKADPVVSVQQGEAPLIHDAGKKRTRVLSGKP